MAWSGSPGRFPASGPHGSGRASFTHPAPQAMNSLRDRTSVPQSGRGQRIPSLQPAETLPRDARLVRAATEPLVPGAPHVVSEAAEAPRVSGDPVVRVVPAQLRRQGDPLLPDREVAVLAAHHSAIDLRDRRKRPRAVLRFTAQLPVRVRPQWWVNPRKSNVPGRSPRSAPLRASGRGRWNGTNRVFSGWRVRPYFSNRFGSTSRTRRASPSRSKTKTASSA